MNKTIFIVLPIMCLLFACSEKMICPAYQSSFILDNKYREKSFSLFEIINGDTIPKGGFDTQRSRSKFFIAKAWSRPERPVLENPYLLARIFNKRPYWKLDAIKPEVIFYSNTDSIRYEQMDPMDTTKTVLSFVSVLTLPTRYPAYNEEQFSYNKKFGHLFPVPPKPKKAIDKEESLEEFLADTLMTESTSNKKGIFGIFKKKDKPPKPRKKKKKGKKNNSEGKDEKEEGSNVN